MRKIWLVVKREYLTRVRTKGFIFGTVAVPLLSIGLLVGATILATRPLNHTFKITILDHAGLAQTIAARFGGKSKAPFLQLVRTVEPSLPDQEVRDELADEVRRGLLDCYLVIPKDVVDGESVEVHAQNFADFQLTSAIHQAVDDAVIIRRLNNRGIQADNLSELVRGANLTLIKIRKGGESEEKRAQTFLTAISIVVILYSTLLVYGVGTMRSVLEEKNARVVEILVSSARPFQLLMGKILGVAGAGFTQYLIWMVTGALITSYGARVASAFRPGVSTPHVQVPFSLLVYVLLFFLAGYFLYASLYAAAGAMVSSEEDAQQIQMPITMLIVAAFFLSFIVMREPNSRLSVIASLIPFLAPILMVFRIALQTPPFWQIILSLILCVVTMLGVVRLSAKIYRVGILMYGKRPSLAELFRWLKYT
jgi:ABC-2 type transport system permease protein